MGMKGKKTGGRKKLNPPVKQRCIMLTDEQCKLLRMWGRGDLSAGLRWLISAAAPLIRKVEKNQSQQVAPEAPRSSG